MGLKAVEPGTHDGGGQTVGYSFFKNVPNLKIVFRKRALKPGSGIGYHEQKEDEIYYVLSGRGVMTVDDLKNYKAVWREPLIGSYRGHTVITMPPPSSGGVALLEMLNVLEGYPLRQRDAATMHFIVEAMKRAYADRAVFFGDPD